MRLRDPVNLAVSGRPELDPPGLAGRAPSGFVPKNGVGANTTLALQVAAESASRYSDPDLTRLHVYALKAPRRTNGRRGSLAQHIVGQSS